MRVGKKWETPGNLGKPPGNSSESVSVMSNDSLVVDKACHSVHTNGFVAQSNCVRARWCRALPHAHRPSKRKSLHHRARTHSLWAPNPSICTLWQALSTTRELLDFIETLSDEFPGGFPRFPGVSHFFPTLITIADPGPAGRPPLLFQEPRWCAVLGGDDPG